MTFVFVLRMTNLNSMWFSFQVFFFYFCLIFVIKYEEHCATNLKVAVSISDGITGIFH